MAINPAPYGRVGLTDTQEGSEAMSTPMAGARVPEVVLARLREVLDLPEDTSPGAVIRATVEHVSGMRLAEHHRPTGVNTGATRTAGRRRQA